MINGVYVCHHNLTESQNMDSLAYELSKMLKVEGKKEKAKPPRIPKTQKEKCAGGRHGRIVECDDGDMCSTCGRIAYY